MRVCPGCGCARVCALAQNPGVKPAVRQCGSGAVRGASRPRLRRRLGQKGAR